MTVGEIQLATKVFGSRRVRRRNATTAARRSGSSLVVSPLGAPLSYENSNLDWQPASRPTTEPQRVFPVLANPDLFAVKGPTATDKKQTRKAWHDPLGIFLRSHTRRVFGARTQSSRLHRAYLEWASKNDEPYFSAKALNTMLHERGLRTIKASTIHWLDLELHSLPPGAALILTPPGDPGSPPILPKSTQAPRSGG